MKLPIALVDAFTDTAFKGNPAGVCLLEPMTELSDAQMANVAMEMNQAETAYLRARASLPGEYDLRWFTPTVEVSLCGHATLASAHYLWESGTEPSNRPLVFHTLSGPLCAARSGSKIELDFPAEVVHEEPFPLIPSFLPKPEFMGANRMDWFVQLGTEQEVRNLTPLMDDVAAMGKRGLIVTAPSFGEFDFVSRFFAPQSGVPEDSVTGSAHCALGPFWSDRLAKTVLNGLQVSRRTGRVEVECQGDRVLLRGHAVTTLTGMVTI